MSQLAEYWTRTLHSILYLHGYPFAVKFLHAVSGMLDYQAVIISHWLNLLECFN